MSIPHITFTRFIASLAIFIYHFAINSGNKVFPFNNHLLNKIFINGDLAVIYFFILSGFIMAIAYFNNEQKNINIKKFYVSRFSRIYPIYLVSLFLYLLATFFSSEDAHISFFVWVTNFLLIQSWFSNSTINFVTWSLSVEIFFYLLFPFIFSTLRDLSYYKLTIILFLLFFFCVEKSIFRKTYSILPLPIIYTPIFTIGIVIGIIYKKINNASSLEDTGRSISNFAIYIIILLCIFLCISIYKLDATSINDIMPVVIFSLLIPFLSWDTSYLSSIFSNKLFILLGNVSYSLYVLQFPLKFWFDFFLNKTLFRNHRISQTEYFYIFFLFCLSTSIVLFFVFEEPSRKKLRQILSVV